MTPGVLDSYETSTQAAEESALYLEMRRAVKQLRKINNELHEVDEVHSNLNIKMLKQRCT